MKRTYYAIKYYDAYEFEQTLCVYRNREWAEAVLEVMRGHNKADDEDYKLIELTPVEVEAWLYSNAAAPV